MVLVVIKEIRVELALQIISPQSKAVRRKHHTAQLSNLAASGGICEECFTLTQKIGPAVLLKSFSYTTRYILKGSLVYAGSQLHDIFEGDFEAHSQARSNTF